MGIPSEYRVYCPGLSISPELKALYSALRFGFIPKRAVAPGMLLQCQTLDTMVEVRVAPVQYLLGSLSLLFFHNAILLVRCHTGESSVDLATRSPYLLVCHEQLDRATGSVLSCVRSQHRDRTDSYQASARYNDNKALRRRIITFSFVYLYYVPRLVPKQSNTPKSYRTTHYSRAYIQSGKARQIKQNLLR